MPVELSKMASQAMEAAEKMSNQQETKMGGGQEQIAKPGGQEVNQDATRFREILNQQAGRQQGPQAVTMDQGQVSGTQKIAGTQATDGAQPRSMGDTILDKLQATSKQQADTLRTVENIAKSDNDISVSSMLRAQEAMLKVQVTEEIGSKTEGKVDQTFETLLKS